MAHCDIELPFQKAPDDFIRLVRSKISGMGGDFNGDTGSGEFSIGTPLGRVAGTYTMGQQVIRIQITDKPFFVGCGQIEDILRKQLA